MRGYTKDGGTLTLPYTAKAHQRRTSTRPCAFLTHPCEDLRPVDEVGIWGERDGGEGLARSGGSVYLRVY